MHPKKTAADWFAEYAESHQNHLNELINWVCVPLLFWCVLGFVWSIPVPETWLERAPWFNWALVAMAAATIFYTRLSPALAAGLLFFMAMCYTVLVLLDLSAPWPVGKICSVVFVLAWTGQFVGHVLERKRPSFSQDLLFLLIGPAWLLSFVYRKIGQRY